ncbi:MAG: DUF3795 domain-containing protein [Promethearchaeota archaeon]
MSINKNLLAPCGLYCGVCATRYAYKNNDERLKQKLAKSYSLEVGDIKCEGCLSNFRSPFCNACSIRRCVKKKNISGCHECEEFPCRRINKFPFKIAKEFMLKSIPARKKRTDEEWVKWEEANWTCSSCNEVGFRGANRCPKCKNEINPQV